MKNIFLQQLHFFERHEKKAKDRHQKLQHACNRVLTRTHNDLPFYDNYTSRSLFAVVRLFISNIFSDIE
jgi:hypothetical protein